MAVEKVYLATKEDLAKVNTADFLKPALEIKKNTHPTKTINDVALKSIIYIPETKNGTTALKPYILVEKNENNVVVLRQYVDKWGIIDDTSPYYFDGNSVIENWLDTTYISRFSESIQNYMVNANIKYYNNQTLTIITRKIYIPSAFEVGNYTSANDGDTTWFSTSTEMAAYYEEAIPTLTYYWTRTYINSKYRNVGPQGQSYNDNPNTGTCGYRPCISFSKALPLNDENEVIDGIIYENEPVETIAEDNKYYRIKDTNAVHLTDVKTPVSSANKIVTENELGDKQDKGKATISNVEYSLDRHTLTVTDGSTTTSYNFLTAEVIEDGD